MKMYVGTATTEMPKPIFPHIARNYEMATDSRSERDFARDLRMIFSPDKNQMQIIRKISARGTYSRIRDYPVKSAHAESLKE